MELMSLNTVRNKTIRRSAYNDNIDQKHFLKYSNRKVFDRKTQTYATLSKIYERIKEDNTVRVLQKLPGQPLKDVTADALASYIKQRIGLTNLPESDILNLISQVG